ncbi:MAG: hypothetical protein JO307_03135 [Bryobacterales bacterium]|nr:hypothetical protein [Bryobacterales bacterium]MBV9399310.1 hypothetical protein [Bryobacterales bacterium]
MGVCDGARDWWPDWRRVGGGICEDGGDLGFALRRAIVSRGWFDDSPVENERDCLSIGEVNVHALFTRVAAVVHHGGAGTTTAAALAGAPQVVIPNLYDQHYWAQRVHSLGIGTAHVAGAPTSDSLASALAQSLRPEVRARARGGGRSAAGRDESCGAEIACGCWSGCAYLRLLQLFLTCRFLLVIQIAQIVPGIPVLANRLEEFRIGHQLLHYPDGKRFCIRLRVLDRNVDLQRAEVDALEAFHHFPRARKRAPIHIQPDIVAKSHRRDRQCVAFPLAHRVAVPPGRKLGTRFRQRLAVRQDLAHVVVGVVHDHNRPVPLHDLFLIGMRVELHQPERPAMCVRVVLAVIRLALVPDLSAPLRVREPFFKARAQVAELRHGRLARSARRRRCFALAVPF